MKKFPTYFVSLLIVLSIIGSILFGGLIKYHFEGGKRFTTLQKTSLFFASIPINIKKMINFRSINLNKPPKLKKHKNKKRFEQFIQNKRNALLILPRYDHNLGRSLVDIIDLNNFRVIHTYKHNISKMWEQIQNKEEFSRVKIDSSPMRFEYRHPLILNDGSLISDGEYSPEFKIDFCSNLMWINDQERFHHSKMLDHEKNIWISGQLFPFSKIVQKFKSKGFNDDAIIKINTNGKILYKKSIIEILIENKLGNVENFIQERFLIDPLHLNDIEPALSDTKFWKKGDIFLSIRNQSAIIHFRPVTNKVINYITGPFSQQHDVDIISEKEISIFNNNNFLSNNEYTEVLIYNFETNQFKKLFNDELQKENFKTLSNGLSQILNDGSLKVEETDHGRIILFNNKGQKEWEFVNKDINGDIGRLSWSRIIEDELFILKFKSLVENKKCIN